MTPISNHDGPFMQNSRGPGLLRRLLGGGSSDPTAPHTHNDLSTSDMHRRSLERTAQSTPVTPKSSPFGTIGTDTFNGSPADSKRRPLLISIIVWLFGHPRIAIALIIAAVAGFNLVTTGATSRVSDAADGIRSIDDLQSQIEEGTFSTEDLDVPQAVTPSTAPTPVDPTANMANLSSLDATVTKVTGNTVTLNVGAAEFLWATGTPAVRSALVRNTGEEVTVYWGLENNEITVAGVVGPNATVRPPGA